MPRHNSADNTTLASRTIRTRAFREGTNITIGHNDQINLDLVRLVGADRVVLGSDYCFDMGLTDPVGTVERLGALSDAERDPILGTTAAKLLRL